MTDHQPALDLAKDELPSDPPIGALVRYSAMCRAIAQAHQVDEVKDIRDKAIALEHYARLASNLEAERQCREIRLRAERRCGQLLAERQMAKGAAQPGVGRRGGTTLSNGTTALSDLGVTRDQSSRWQQLAGVPEPAFEAALAGAHPTTSGIINAHREPAANPVDDHALLLWGRLRDFDRHHLLDLNPAKVPLLVMTDPMRADFARLAPRVASWLILVGRRSIGPQPDPADGRAVKRR